LKKLFRSFLFLPVVASLACFSAASLNADTVFSTYDGTYYSSNGRFVTGNSVGFPGYEETAVAFTPTQNYSLSQISLGLTFDGVAGAFGTDGATVTLQSDAAGVPGTVLESWSVSGLPPSSGTSGSQTLTDVDNIFLAANTQYWVVATPSANDTLDLWNTGDGAVFGNEEIWNGSTWTSLAPYDLAAVDITGSAVPEPASLALALGGLAIAAGLLRRRKA